jgi:HNH endonuclease
VARIEARFPTSIWDDATFTGMDRTAQWLFLLLYSQPEVNAAGILPLRIRRWAGCASNGEVEDVSKALAELAASGWIEADLDTEEVYLPTFFAWERIGGQPRRVVAANEAIRACFSPRLRSCAVGDLTREVDSSKPKAPRGMRAEVLARDGYRCHRCGWRPGDPVPVKNGRGLYRGLEIDHIHPRSRGGTDRADNLQVLCTSCNSSKGARV